MKKTKLHVVYAHEAELSAWHKYLKIINVSGANEQENDVSIRQQ